MVWYTQSHIAVTTLIGFGLTLWLTISRLFLPRSRCSTEIREACVRCRDRQVSYEWWTGNP